MAWSSGETRGQAQAGRDPISVSQAVAAAKARVNEMGMLSVTGEVTGFRGPNARSGHCYFQVKDDAAAMDVIVWRGVYASSGIKLRDGLQLQINGSFDVYAGSGRLSFIARRISVAGEGLLRQQVAELARRLEREGLMDAARKRPIPRFCTRVAVCTSLSGSVIDDVRRTLKRRNPLVELQLFGCQVQGPGAPATIERALAAAAAVRPDAILLVRGGGSFEDLMTFNDEGLARAVAACPVPVVTGIGHEPDTSICDMVSDRRCSTPTAAAESVAPAFDEIVSMTGERQVRLARAMQARLEREGQATARAVARMGRAMSARLGRERTRLEAVAAHRCLQEPAAILDSRRVQLLQAEQRLLDAIPRSLSAKSEAVGREAERIVAAGTRLLRPHEQRLASLAATLDALSPLKVLGRGYAIARTSEGGVVTDASAVSVGDELDVLLGKGSLRAKVTSVTAGAETAS